MGYNNDTILIRFVAINDYGNQFYLDNVNIKGQNIVFNKNLSTKNITLFPNPNNGSFNVITDHHALGYEVFNAIGERVSQGKIDEYDKIINLSNKITSGIYFVVFKNKEISIRKKFSVY